MIDLTPLDVRKKRGDFGKGLRGYDPGEVDTFLDLVAERLEELVKENLTLKERVERLSDQVNSQESRERAVHEALVTAQELREDVRSQAQREAELIRKEAEGEATRIVREAEAKVVERRQALEEVERKRIRFLRSYRGMLERELDGVEVEEARPPLEDVEVELDLQGGRSRRIEGAAAHEAAAAAGEAQGEPHGSGAGSEPASAGDGRTSRDADDPVHELAAAAEEGWAERDARRDASWNISGDVSVDDSGDVGGDVGGDAGGGTPRDASGEDLREEAGPADRGFRSISPSDGASEDVWSGEGADTRGQGGAER